MTIGKELRERIWEEPPQPIVSEPERKTRSGEMTRTDFTVAEQVPGHEKEEKGIIEPSPQRPSSLFSSEEMARFRSRWDGIQTGFVDEPQRAVKEADGLVTEVISRLAQVFADERAKLEAQFDQNQHQEPSTEDLRLALRQYRTFFGRLLAV